MNPDTATPAAGISASVIIPKSTVTRPDDPSQYIRTYAKDVAYVTGKNPVPPSATTAKKEPAKTRVAFFPPAQPVARREPDLIVENPVIDTGLPAKYQTDVANEPIEQEMFSTSKADEDIFTPPVEPEATTQTPDPVPTQPIVYGDTSPEIKMQVGALAPTVSEKMIGKTNEPSEPVIFSQVPDKASILERLRAKALEKKVEVSVPTSAQTTAPESFPLHREINILKSQADLSNTIYRPAPVMPKINPPLPPRPLYPTPTPVTTGQGQVSFASPIVKPSSLPTPVLSKENFVFPENIPAPVLQPILQEEPLRVSPAVLKASAVIMPAPVIFEPTRTATETISPIHTYSSDFADHIDERKATTFSVLAAQQDSAQPTALPNPARSRNTVKIVLATIMIMIGLGLIGGAGYLFTSKQIPILTVAKASSLIPYDESVEIKGTGVDLQQQLANKAQGVLVQGNILLAYVSVSTTTQQGSVGIPQPGGVLINRLELPVPDIFLRNIDPTSTVGVIHAGEQTSPFFIFRVNSYERTFAGMLAWEPAAPNDLGILYPPYPEDASSTPSTNTAGFIDIVIANHNVREYRDSRGRSVLLYGYLDKQTLILARDAAAFTAIAARMPSVGGR